MTKVLIVVSDFGYGGVRSFVMNYYKNIDRTNFHIDIYNISDEKSPFEEEFKSLGGDFYYDNEQFTSVRTLHFIGKWYRFFKENNYDAVHANCNLANTWILIAAKLAGIKTLISHTHTTEYKLPGSIAWKLFVCLRRFILNHLGVVRVACGMEAGTTTYGKGKKFFVVNNIIDYSKFKAKSPSEVKSFCEELDIPENSIVYSNISLWSENKNQSYVVDVFREIKKIQKNAFLILGGPVIGEESKKVKDEIISKIKMYGLNESVMILGTVSNISAYFSITDCWLFPSIHEGLPIALLELQAASVPIISSDTVTKHVDLGLGLVHFMSLNQSASDWAKLAIRLHKQPLSDSQIEAAFVKHGFDIKQNVRLLEDAYWGKLNKQR